MCEPDERICPDCGECFYGNGPKCHGEYCNAFEDEADIEIRCPACNSIAGEYMGEAYDDEDYLGAEFHCADCGAVYFTIDNQVVDDYWQ